MVVLHFFTGGGYFMKEVKYKGDLEEDFNLITDEAKKDKEKFIRDFGILSVILASSCFGGLLFNGVNLTISIIVSCVLSGILYQLNIMLEKKDKEDEIEAERRLNSLNIQLEDNDVQIDKVKLINKIETFKIDKNYTYQDFSESRKTVNGIIELEKYWSILDNKEQIQVLKFVKTTLIDNNYEETNENYFLLEEEDKEKLETSIKKVLKIDK